MVEPSPGEEELFEAARDLAPGAERSSYLDRVCGENSALRQRLEDLLRVAGEAERFFTTPLVSSRRPEGQETSLRPPPGSGGGPGRPDTEQSLWLGKQIGGYCLGERIGEGGFGDVYQATQTRPVRRQVALKIIKPGMDSRQVLARFELERQALALMDHPAIARVLDAGTADNGRPFFVMDLIHGLPITEYCDQRELGIRERLSLFVRVCQGLQHAHQKGVIHRDIKPSNILVSEQDGVAAPKVIDFGIAKAIGERAEVGTAFTRGGQVLGTPAYMSPEQAGLNGLDIDTRSDVYALGALLYELLIGCPPFEAHELLRVGPDEMLRLLREQEPLRPSNRLTRLGSEEQAARALRRGCEASQLLRTMRGDLDWIVVKCLEKDRTRRYQTANGLAADIERFLGGEAIIARPPSAAYRAMKALRRNRVLFSAGGLVLVVLLVAVGVTSRKAQEATWAKEQVLRANAALEHESRRAEEERDKARAAQALAEDERRATVRQVYPRLMARALAAWNHSDYQALRDIVSQASTSPDRAFEWFHWQRALHLEEVSLAGPPTGGARVVYRPDGRRVATGGNDGTVIVWDTVDGRDLLRFHAQDHEITTLAFTPDGRWLLTGGERQGLRMWDAETGQPRPMPGLGRKDLSSTILAPDGLQAASLSTGGYLRLWKLTEGGEPRTLGPFGGEITAAAFFGDNHRMALGDSKGTLRVVDLDKGGEVLAAMPLSKRILALVVHPDDRRVVVADTDHILHILDPIQGIELLRMSAHGRDGRIQALSLSEDGRRLLSASVYRTVRVWDVDTGEVVSTLRGLTTIQSGALSPNGQQVAIGGVDGVVRLWGVSGSPHHRPLAGHSARVTALSFTADGQWLVSAGNDGNLKTWDVHQGAERWNLATNPSGFDAVAVLPNGAGVVCGGGEGRLGIWNLQTGENLHTLAGHRNRVTTVAVSPDGTQVASGAQDGEVRIWTTLTGQLEAILEMHQSEVVTLAYLPDNQHLVSADAEGFIRLSEAKSGKRVWQDYLRSGGLVPPTLASSDASGDGRDQALEFGFRAAVSPDGKWVAASRGTSDLSLRELSAAKPPVTLLSARAPVTALAFSPDGTRLVSGARRPEGADDVLATPEGPRGPLKIWDTTTGREMLTLQPHPTGVSAVAFSPDGRWLASGGEDGSIWVYGSVPARR